MNKTSTFGSILLLAAFLASCGQNAQTSTPLANEPVANDPSSIEQNSLPVLKDLPAANITSAQTAFVDNLQRLSDAQLKQVETQISDYKKANPTATQENLNTQAINLVLSIPQLKTQNLYNSLNSVERRVAAENSAVAPSMVSHRNTALSYTSSYFPGATDGPFQADAFRHIFWNYRMTYYQGAQVALTWGNAHECIYNGSIIDSCVNEVYGVNRSPEQNKRIEFERTMDLANNNEARRYTTTYPSGPDDNRMAGIISNAVRYNNVAGMAPQAIVRALTNTECQSKAGKYCNLVYFEASQQYQYWALAAANRSEY